MSPRAACRLAALGFTQVHDYAPGKLDWLAHHLPTEGSAAADPTAGSRLRHDVPVARPDEPMAAVRARIAASRYRFALVVAGDGTLLGRLRHDALTADPALPAGAVAEPGPSTVRPHEPLAPLAARLRERNLGYVIVTDPEGRLLGTLHRADLSVDDEPT